MADLNLEYDGDSHLALRNDLVLKRDGDKPILYPLDFLESSFFVLTPSQGFVLSLLDGRRRLCDLDHLFRRIFPKAGPDVLVGLLNGIDRLIRENPTTSGIGSCGAFHRSKGPIEDCAQHDPREFVIGAAEYGAEMTDIRRCRRLHAPISVMAVPTHSCQTRCVYCYAERRRVPELPLARWRELIEEMTTLKIRLISLDNGDIFARADGIDLLECMLDHEMHFLLSTKSHVSEEQVRRLVAAGFSKKVRSILSRKVQLSIDAWDDEIVARMMMSTAFKRNLLKTFDSFMKHGISPKIKAVMTPLNADQPEKLVRHFYERGAREFQFVRYVRSFFHHSDDLFLDEQSVQMITRQLARVRERYPDISLSEGMNAIDPISAGWTPAQRKEIWDRRAGCGGGWSMLGISADGAAFLCEQMTLDEPYRVGDLRVQSIMDVWNGDPMFDFIYPPRSRFKGTICHSCKDFEACHWEKGYCYRNAYFCYGTIYEAPPLCPKQQKSALRMT